MSGSNSTMPVSGHPLDNRVPPPLVVVLIGAAMWGIALRTSPLEIGVAARFDIGGLAITLGLGVVALGFLAFRRAGTTIDPVNPDHASSLVTSGIYRHTRNPMYVGFAAMLVGWSVCLAAPWALLGPVAFILFTTRFQIIPEERVMSAKFGAEYEQYRSRVRRWL